MTPDDRGAAEHGVDVPDYEPEEPDPGGEAEAVEFDVTSGEDLVEGLPEPDSASADVRSTFWLLVALVDVGLLAVAVGPMLAYFWGWTVRGGALFLLGCLALLDVAIRAWRFQRSSAP